MDRVIWSGQDVDGDKHAREEGYVDGHCSPTTRHHLDKLQSITDGSADRKVYRVVVVDDSVLPRVAARALLSASDNLQLVGEATAGTEARSVVRSARADLVLVDVDMPGMDGAETARQLKGEFPDLTIVAWTVSDSSDDLLRMVRAGCAGYVLKDAGPSELQRALMAALRQETPMPRRMIPDALRKAADSTPVARGTPAHLTPRELEMVRGIAKGHTTKRLAQESGLAIPSVDTHLRNIFRKLNASNRGEAVSAALRQGLITLADL